MKLAQWLGEYRWDEMARLCARWVRPNQPLTCMKALESRAIVVRHRFALLRNVLFGWKDELDQLLLI